MGLFSGLKKIGRGIGRGVKKGVKAFDKFDDWIKLKELAQIGSFIPGVNIIAKPLSMVYSGYDVAKNVKEGNLWGAGLAGLQMYGTSKINTTGFGGGAKGLNIGQTGAEALRHGVDPNATIGFRSQLFKNFGNFLNPFGLSAGEQVAFNTVGMPLLKQVLPGGEQASPKRQGYSPSYQPMEYGQIQGFSPTTQLPTQAQGGITGDDWHKPINRLPANYEGWVTEPSIATLGEQGKEAVLPLNKLLPAMNKGGLNYSTGHAIVGEAGPEYVTRLGPGEEHWAQGILDMPAMREGGIINPLMRGASNLFGRTIPLMSLIDIPGHWYNAYQGRQEVPSLLNKGLEALGDLAGVDLAREPRETYGVSAAASDTLRDLLYAIPWAGWPLGVAYENRDDLMPQGFSLGRMPLSMSQYSAPKVEIDENNLVNNAFQSIAEAQDDPNTTRPTEQVQDQTTPVPPTTSIQSESNMANPLGDLEGLLDFDNPETSNYLYWKKKDPDRLEAMVNDLIETSMADLSDNEKRGMVQESWRQAGSGVPAPGVSYPLPSNQDINYRIGSGGGQRPSPMSQQMAANQAMPIPTPPGTASQYSAGPRPTDATMAGASSPVGSSPQSLFGAAGSGRQHFFQNDPNNQQAFRAVVEENQRAGRYYPHSDGGQYPYPENWTPNTASEYPAFGVMEYEAADLAQRFVNRGMPPRSAAHLAASLMQESGGRIGMPSWSDPSGTGKPGRAGGIASWRDPSATGLPSGRYRLTGIEDKVGVPIERIPIKEQLDYILEELQGGGYDKSWETFSNKEATDEQLRKAVYDYWRWHTEGPNRFPDAHPSLGPFMDREYQGPVTF